MPYPQQQERMGVVGKMRTRMRWRMMMRTRLTGEA